MDILVKTKTPRTDKLLEELRHQGPPDWNADDMMALLQHARKLERELNTVLSLFRHRHVNNAVDDACKKCGLDLRHEIHERVAA